MGSNDPILVQEIDDFLEELDKDDPGSDYVHCPPRVQRLHERGFVLLMRCERQRITAESQMRQMAGVFGSAAGAAAGVAAAIIVKLLEG